MPSGTAPCLVAWRGYPPDKVQLSGGRVRTYTTRGPVIVAGVMGAIRVGLEAGAETRYHPA